jgi:hypothetical protein
MTGHSGGPEEVRSTPNSFGLPFLFPYQIQFSVFVSIKFPYQITCTSSGTVLGFRVRYGFRMVIINSIDKNHGLSSR